MEQDRVLSKEEITKGISKISNILSSPNTTEGEIKLVFDVIEEIKSKRLERVEKEIRSKFGEEFIQLLKDEFPTIEKIYKERQETIIHLDETEKTYIVTFDRGTRHILIHGRSRKEVYEFLQKFYKGNEYYVIYDMAMIYDMRKWKDLLRYSEKIGEIFIKGN